MSKKKYCRDDNYRYEADDITKELFCFKGAEYCVLNHMIFCSLFNCLKNSMCSLRCRSPPLSILNYKNLKLIGGKINGNNA